MFKMRYRILLFFLLLFFVITDAFLYIGNSGYGVNFFTPVSLTLKYLSLLILIYFSSKSSLKADVPDIVRIVFILLFFWNIITIVRGGIFAKDYWDWKFLLLASALFLMIPLAFFIGKNFYLSRLIIGDVLKYLFLFGFLIILLTMVTSPELYSRLMIPVSLFIIFIPYLRLKWRILILIVAVTSILLFIGFRTNIIKIGAALLIVSSYYFRGYIRLSWIKLAHAFLFFLPLILLFLGITRQYNFFEKLSKNDEFVYEYKSGESENLTSDTRTFLYIEVFESLIKNNSLFLGEGGSGYYRTNSFDYMVDDRRYGSEVGLLNTLLYSGIIGVILYAAMLFFTSFYAICRSNNWLSKMFGLYITFRWMIFFVEEYTQFDLNFLFLWIAIGLVSSTKFRSMNDKEIIMWVRGIFDKRYEAIYKWYLYKKQFSLNANRLQKNAL